MFRSPSETEYIQYILFIDLLLGTITGGDTSKRMYIHPKRPPSTTFRILFQNSSFSDSGHDDRSTRQYPRSQSLRSLVCDLQRKMDSGNNVERSFGIRGISSLSTFGIG